MFLLRIGEDNRGLTLIEVMLSTALLVIIMGCTVLLMSSAGKGFVRGKIQANLQEQAQDAANYLTDAVISSNYISCGSGTDAAGNVIDYIMIYNIDKEDIKDGTVDPAVSPIKAFVKVADSMYFYSVDNAVGAGTLSHVIDGSAAPSKYNLLCSNVDSFVINYINPADNPGYPKPVVKYTIALKVNNPKTEFTLSNSVGMRNKEMEVTSFSVITTP